MPMRPLARMLSPLWLLLFLGAGHEADLEEEEEEERAQHASERAREHDGLLVESRTDAPGGRP